LYNRLMSAIPKTAAPFFQEYTFADLDSRHDAGLVIERLLAYGNRIEIAWAFAEYGQDRVRQWLLDSGANRLPKRRYALWCILLDVPAHAIAERRNAWPH